MAWLLRTAAEGSTENIDAVMRGYREHVQLTDEELERLPGVLNMRALWLACLEYRMAVNSGNTPTTDEGWMRRGSTEYAERLAAQAIAALRAESANDACFSGSSRTGRRHASLRRRVM